MLNAASIRFSPVSVEILSDQAASSISLYNQSNESADLQVRIFLNGDKMLVKIS